MEEIINLGRMGEKVSNREQKREKTLSELIERLKGNVLRIFEDVIRQELKLLLRTEVRSIITELVLELSAPRELIETRLEMGTEIPKESNVKGKEAFDSEKTDQEAWKEGSAPEDVEMEDEGMEKEMFDNLESEFRESMERGEGSNVHSDNTDQQNFTNFMLT